MKGSINKGMAHWFLPMSQPDFLLLKELSLGEMALLMIVGVGILHYYILAFPKDYIEYRKYILDKVAI